MRTHRAAAGFHLRGAEEQAKTNPRRQGPERQSPPVGALAGRGARELPGAMEMPSILTGEAIAWLHTDAQTFQTMCGRSVHFTVYKQSPAKNKREMHMGGWVPLVLSGKESVCSAGDAGLTPGLGRSPGEGNGNSLEYSGLGSPMDRGAWWATVGGIAKSWTWLSD